MRSMSGRGRGRRGRGGRGFPATRGGGGTLSDRFSQLNIKNIKNTQIGGRELRRTAVQNTQKAKREAQQAAFRKGGNPKAAAKSVGFQRATGGGRGRGGRGRGIRAGERGEGRGGRGARGGRGGRGGRGKLVSVDDLDAELDEYHFKAGKGPDPKILRAQKNKEKLETTLDADMEAYWNAKKKPEVAATGAASGDAAGVEEIE